MPLPDELLRAYIGGAGLGAWLMHRLGPPGADPLAPAAPLAFVFSPLVGTPLTTSAKFAVVAKSPLTGHAERRALLQPLRDLRASSPATTRSLCIGRARAAGPSCWSTPGGARLIDARRPSGAVGGGRPRRGCARSMGRRWRVACDRPGGRARRALRHDLHDGRHAGRGGLGRGDGRQERIKAVAVRAATKVARWPTAEAVLGAARDLRERSFGLSHGQVPRARHAGQPARLQRDQHPAHPQLPGRDLRRRRRMLSAEDLARDAVRSRGTAAPPARSAASTSTPPGAARRCGWSTRTSSRSARCAGSPTLTQVLDRQRALRRAAGSTPSRRAARSPGRWSAPSAG